MSKANSKSNSKVNSTLSPGQVPPADKEKQDANAPVSSGDDQNDRIIDGLRYPRQERQIDQLGFETTRHALKFRGVDWDIPLTQKRDALTKSFVAEAAAAVGEPESNITQLRFVVASTYLKVRFSVRHKVHESAVEVQEKLARAPWSAVKELYEPREKKQHPATRRVGTLHPTAGGAGCSEGLPTAGTLSAFGRVAEPAFSESDTDEEPAPYEKQEEAKVRRTNSRLFLTVGVAQ